MKKKNKNEASWCVIAAAAPDPPPSFQLRELSNEVGKARCRRTPKATHDYFRVRGLNRDIYP